MSTWQSVENGMIAALQALQVSDQPLLATVRGQNLLDRKTMLAVVERERLPAALVISQGRNSSDKTSHRAGVMTFRLWLIDSSERDENEARIGGEGVSGIYALAEVIASALQDLSVSGRQVFLLEESPIVGYEGMAVWEQQYEVRQPSISTAPTFGGVSLAGSLSSVHVEAEPRRQAVSEFAFPGIDGVFQRRLGIRGRSVYWRGQLRATTQVAMNAIISAIENAIADGQEQTVMDEWSRAYSNCVAHELTCDGSRRLDELTGQVLQDFELEFRQLA